MLQLVIKDNNYLTLLKIPVESTGLRKRKTPHSVGSLFWKTKVLLLWSSNHTEVIAFLELDDGSELIEQLVTLMGDDEDVSYFHRIRS